MKKLLWLVAWICPLWIMAQDASCPMPNLSLTNNETIDYYAYFQLGLIHINGMNAHIELEEDSFRNESAFSVLAVCETERAMETFFNMKDSFWVHMRQKDLLPLYFYEHDFEKKLEILRNYSFAFTDSSTTVTSMAYTEESGVTGSFTFKKECPLDAMSLLYRMRNHDYSTAAIGERFSFWFFDKGKSIPLYLEYQGKDTITLRNDTSYQCLRFIFNTVEGTLFSKKHPVQLWLSDDENRVPIYGEAKLKIGYAKAELVRIRNSKCALSPFVLDKKTRRRR